MNESIMVQKPRHKHSVIRKSDRSRLDVFRDTTDAQVKEASSNGETSSGDIELCVLQNNTSHLVHGAITCSQVGRLGFR